MLLLIVAIIGGGVWAIYNTPLDAIPDLSDVQVIVSTDWEDRSPNIIEDQITYPIVTQLLSAPKVKAVRANSFYGSSLVYVIFEDGTDLYWARSRVLEYLSGMAGKLPPGVAPQLGPDATGVGWALEYALIDKTGKHSLADLRTLQDWQVQYQIRAVPGVAEVAPVGGFVKQYQVTIDPDKLLAYKIPINKVVEQIRREQSGSRRPGIGVHGQRVHGARQRLLSKVCRHREGGRRSTARWDPHSRPRRRLRPDRPGHSPRRGGLQRDGRRGRRHRRRPLRRERL